MQPIAIVGIGCRFPGADGPAALWRIARDGLCTVGEIPADRWRVEDYFSTEPGTPGKMSSRVGGFVEGVDRFDAPFFGVSPREAAQMDPQQRLLLEVCWETFENAGLLPADVAGKAVGAFVGVQRNDYGRLMAGTESFNAYTVAGNQFSMTVSRLAHFFDLRGPCIAVDAGCSSALAGIHLACASLETGESDLALAGGVHLSLAPHDSVAASQAWMLSPSGMCRSFDAGADGYVRSEGCGLFVLKRLEDAQHDGDPIAAIIRGTAFLQEGRPGGFTSPWGPEVARTFARALERGQVPPHSIGYVEAHGVGSPVADATEYQALAQVLSIDRDATMPCYLGSIKPNIGHTETAAGAASLIKAIHVLATGEVPRLLGFQRLNPDIDERLRRLVVPEAPTAFPSSSPRRAAVNAFGLGGTNATIVLQEAPSAPKPPVRSQAALTCLSARTPSALRELARRYGAFLESEDASIEEVAAASIRRAPFQHRAVIVASTRAELRRALADLAADAPDASRPAGEAPLVVRGQSLPQDPRLFVLLNGAQGRAAMGALWKELRIPVAGLVDAMTASTAEICAKYARDGELLVDLPTGALYDLRRGATLHAPGEGPDWLPRLLAEMWVRGAPIDFRPLEPARPRHVALPTYPFERERCWIDESGPGTGTPPSFEASPSRAERERPSALVAVLETGDDAERQRALTDLLRLGVAKVLAKPPGEVPVDVPLRDLGIASIDVLQLMEQARSLTGIDLDVARFMDQPPIQEIASRIVFGTGEDLRIVDLGAEGNLEASIDASGLPDSASPPRSLLLTGATGFLGAFLLRELLDGTGATVYALVRAKDSLEAERRLAHNLGQYGLSTEGFHDRVRAVIGDLGKPLLGLSYDSFDLLGTRLDGIYHCGAQVNWAYPYRSLKEGNVQATEEVVRLAAHMKRKPIHHVSTIGVFPLGQPQLGLFRERDGLVVPERSEWLGTGYNQSKWAAEKLLYTAGSRRGLQVSIYRPGFVTGRSDTGVTQMGRHDFIAAFMKGCIQMGQAPDWDVALDLMPVDYLARAIVGLSRKPAAPGSPMAFNMVNPEPLKYEAVYDLLRRCGHALETVAYGPWRERVLALAKDPGDSALFPFWPYYAQLTIERAAMLREHMGERLPLDDENVRSGLAGLDVRCPSVRSLVPTYAEFFRRVGYFPPPRNESPPSRSSIAR